MESNLVQIPFIGNELPPSKFQRNGAGNPPQVANFDGRHNRQIAFFCQACGNDELSLFADLGGIHWNIINGSMKHLVVNNILAIQNRGEHGPFLYFFCFLIAFACGLSIRKHKSRTLKNLDSSPTSGNFLGGFLGAVGPFTDQIFNHCQGNQQKQGNQPHQGKLPKSIFRRFHIV